MRIVIVGGGRVGRELASRLSEKQQEVVIVEKDPEVAKELTRKLDILVIDEDGANMAALEKAGIRGTEIFIAVTSIDELNLMACMMADRAGVPITIARVRNPEGFSNIADTGFSKDEIGVDYVINPERELALEISKMIHFPDAEEIEYFAGERIMLVSVTVGEDAEITGQTLNDMPLPPECIIAGIKKRDDRFIFPSGKDTVETGDRVYLIGNAKNMRKASWLIHHEETMIKTVVILGGENTGAYLASILENDPERKFTVKLIDKNENRSEELIRKLGKTIIIHGNHSELAYFNKEEIAEADALIAVTGDDRTNIVASLMGHKLGAKKVISEISNNEYAETYNISGIKNYINSHLITASRILRLTRKGDILSLSHLKEENVEAIELVVNPSCRAAGKKVREAKLPAGVLIGTIFRNGEIIVPGGDTVLEPGDDLVIITRTSIRHKVESYFC